MVLGANPASFTPQSGANGGYVVRYNLNVPFLNGPAGSQRITNFESVGAGPGKTKAGGQALCSEGQVVGSHVRNVPLLPHVLRTAWRAA